MTRVFTFATRRYRRDIQLFKAFRLVELRSCYTREFNMIPNSESFLCIEPLRRLISVKEGDKEGLYNVEVGCVNHDKPHRVMEEI